MVLAWRSVGQSTIEQRNYKRTYCRAERLRLGSRFCVIGSGHEKLDWIHFEDVRKLSKLSTVVRVELWRVEIWPKVVYGRV